MGTEQLLIQWILHLSLNPPLLLMTEYFCIFSCWAVFFLNVLPPPNAEYYIILIYILLELDFYNYGLLSTPMPMSKFLFLLNVWKLCCFIVFCRQYIICCYVVKPLFFLNCLIFDLFTYLINARCILSVLSESCWLEWLKRSLLIKLVPVEMVPDGLVFSAWFLFEVSTTPISFYIYSYIFFYEFIQ